ncbi:MAG: peptidase S41, partial [Cyanobacteriota bacterium]
APDVVVELSDAQRKELQQDRTQIGTVKDPQFAKALEVLQQKIAAQGNTRASSPGR